MNTFKDLRTQRLHLMYEKYGDLASAITEALMKPTLDMIEDKVQAYTTFMFKVEPGEAASVLFFLQEFKYITEIPIQARLVKDNIQITVLE